ncbi:scarecrow-like protein 3 isoform X1 [Ricinus communis]|uniref:scarecrow-like protein 3 isoform X1 n=1 Tax=Ricinus communis TaxID=3988 RepID=UPI00201AE26B|nr:scarecrow-like protein 3 isoform X1 [Ricinus communis]
MAQEDGASSVTSPPVQFFPWMSLSPGYGSPYPWLRELKSEERGLYLIHLLHACASHVAAGSVENANICLEHISHLASADGDTMQRIAAYFTEALADRILKKGWPCLHRALTFTKKYLVSEEILVQRLFFELFPFLKLAYVITNQAIVEAMEGEKMVHIIDLNSFEPAQWINLLQTLSARPEGPPHLRITGIHEQKEVLEQMALRLTEEAEKLDIPFQFNPIMSKLEDLDIESLRVKTGEALAVSSVLQLHSLLAADDELLKQKSPATKNSKPNHFHIPLQIGKNQRTLGEWLEKDLVHVYTASPDSALSPLSLAPSPKMGSFLNALWGLSPKLMVITEQESNHNGFTLMERVTEALNFYAALFDCLESTVSRPSIERQKVEKMLLGEEIKNIIACEGIERKERHEKLEKWILRLELAGFGRVPLSYHGMLQASRLLQSYGYDGYKIKEENGCSVICWQDRPLFSVSAWRFRSAEVGGGVRGQDAAIIAYMAKVPILSQHACFLHNQRLAAFLLQCRKSFLCFSKVELFFLLYYSE